MCFVGLSEKFFWRRERDLNPRYRFMPVYSLSRRAPSADSDISPRGAVQGTDTQRNIAILRAVPCQVLNRGIFPRGCPAKRSCLVCPRFLRFPRRAPFGSGTGLLPAPHLSSHRPAQGTEKAPACSSRCLSFESGRAVRPPSA